MTIRVTIECDARDCCRSQEFYDYPTDNDLDRSGWHTHPTSAEDHYCKQCWPEVKKEIEEIRCEAI